MKKLILLVLLFTFAGSTFHVLKAEDSVPKKPDLSTIILPQEIDIHPQPISAGDAVVLLKSPRNIISTALYTFTGERLVKQVHDGTSSVIKMIPDNIPTGEYLLKVETENGVGIKKIFFK
jgi:hypothetical protein